MVVRGRLDTTPPPLQKSPKLFKIIGKRIHLEIMYKMQNISALYKMNKIAFSGTRVDKWPALQRILLTSLILQETYLGSHVILNSETSAEGSVVLFHRRTIFSHGRHSDRTQNVSSVFLIECEWNRDGWKAFKSLYFGLTQQTHHKSKPSLSLV